jgi:phosphoribosylglycinamide formyltransferase 1
MSNIAVFVSGNGSNLQSIISAVEAGKIKAAIGLVVSNKADAYALKRAERAGIPTLLISPKDFTNRQSFDREVVIQLKQRDIEYIVLAGYMLLLSPYFIKEYKHKIINIHPSLLPNFRGTEGIKDAMTYGAKVTGVTIHFVDEKMDHGPIIMQESIRIKSGDSLESLTERIHKIEHRTYPKAIELLVDGRLKIKGRRVEILPADAENKGGQVAEEEDQPGEEKEAS